MSDPAESKLLVFSRTGSNVFQPKVEGESEEKKESGEKEERKEEDMETEKETVVEKQDGEKDEKMETDDQGEKEGKEKEQSGDGEKDKEDKVRNLKIIIKRCQELMHLVNKILNFVMKLQHVWSPIQLCKLLRIFSYVKEKKITVVDFMYFLFCYKHSLMVHIRITQPQNSITNF